LGNLASVNRNQGRWKDAEELEVQVMETRVKLLGQDHPDTLSSMSSLASTLFHQDQWVEAEKLLLRVVEMS